ncbi:hypothetical protein C8T65DRAFT_739068 [Cerioporus squamosus]|nr:hypothetical protein C8T65DRAFT_739068 [Cerioporus squamosus]
MSSLSILTAATPSLAQLHLAYAEPLLAHDTRISHALAALSHLVLLELAPKGCKTLRSLSATLEHVEVDFDDGWVEITDPFCNVSDNSAALGANASLPDPVPLLVHSMSTLRTLRTSNINAIIVTVADKLRYPSVRTLALRLAGYRP